MMSSSSPATFDLGDGEVVVALAVGQAVVQLAGLGVDQPGGERPRVAPEQGVRQRAVAPEEPGQVDPGQELGEGVEQRVPQVGQRRLGEQRAVRQRVRAGGA